MSQRAQPTKRQTTLPMPPSPEEHSTAPPPPSGGARHHGALKVAHSMVGRFMHGEVLHAEEIAEFTQDRLDFLLRIGALVPLGAEAQPPPRRPLPAEDAAAQTPPAAPVQDYDQRPGRPRAR